MATKAQMERLVGKALFDGEFRKRLIEDPERAARSLRYRLEPNQAARIRSLSADELEKLGKEFESKTGLDRPPQGISFW